MADNPSDVKDGQASSPAPDVSAASSPAAPVPAAPAAASPDVNASAPSPEGAPKDKPHEQTVPYERLKEKVDEVNSLKERLEALEAEKEPAPFDWGFPVAPAAPEAPAAAAPGPAPAQPDPFSPDQIEEELREKIQDRPFQTLWPMMQEAARQHYIAEETARNKLRSIPDFKDYEDGFNSVPPELVQQAQGDPQLVKYLLAKHRATLEGKLAPPPPPANGTIAPSNPTAAAPPAPSTPAASNDGMEELREKYRKEGEAAVLARLRDTGSIAAEGTGSAPPTDDSDKPELDDAGRLLMSKMGIANVDGVAQRLERFVKGK